METTTYCCPYCKQPFEDADAPPYVKARYCPNCEQPFAVVAFSVGGDVFHCCPSLDARIMGLPDASARIDHVMRLVEPYLMLMGANATYRNELRSELACTAHMPHVVTADEFIEEGLFDPGAPQEEATYDWRVEWVCECRYCGHEIASGRSVFPPTFRLKGECPNCHKRLETRTTYPNRDAALPSKDRMINGRRVAHPQSAISDVDIADFRAMLQRNDLGFPGFANE